MCLLVYVFSVWQEVKSSNNQDETRVVVAGGVDVTDLSVQLFAQEAHSQVSLCYYTVSQ